MRYLSVFFVKGLFSQSEHVPWFSLRQSFWFYCLNSIGQVQFLRTGTWCSSRIYLRVPNSEKYSRLSYSHTHQTHAHAHTRSNTVKERGKGGKGSAVSALRHWRIWLLCGYILFGLCAFTLAPSAWAAARSTIAAGRAHSGRYDLTPKADAAACAQCARDIALPGWPAGPLPDGCRSSRRVRLLVVTRR